MSSFALTAVAGISSSALDAAFKLMPSQDGETTVQFGDGVHGATLPYGACAMPQAIYAAGGGADGNAAEAMPKPSGIRHVLDHRSATGLFQPQAGDEVLVAFKSGQMQRPFVAAPLWSSEDRPPTSSGAADVKHEGLDSVSSHLDSMSEMSETESLRLQMAMDRLSKMMSTLSILLHRIEATDAAVTQNIK